MPIKEEYPHISEPAGLADNINQNYNDAVAGATADIPPITYTVNKRDLKFNTVGIDDDSYYTASVVMTSRRRFSGLGTVNRAIRAIKIPCGSVEVGEDTLTITLDVHKYRTSGFGANNTQYGRGNAEFSDLLFNGLGLNTFLEDKDFNLGFSSFTVPDPNNINSIYFYSGQIVSVIEYVPIYNLENSFSVQGAKLEVLQRDLIRLQAMNRDSLFKHDVLNGEAIYDKILERLA